MKKTNKSILLVLLLSLLLVIFLFGCSSSNQTSDEKSDSQKEENKDTATFPEKDITVILPQTPGGGFDTTLRLFTPYFEKHLPGDSSVIVKNMPGGNWTIGINEVYRAKPDGYTLGYLNLPGNLTNQVLDEADYNLSEIEWIGQITETKYVIAGSNKSKYKTIDELVNAEGTVRVASDGLSTTVGLGTVLVANSLGIDIKRIPVNGTAEAAPAAMRGDVDYIQYPYESVAQYFKSGDLNPLLVIGEEGYSDISNTPTASEKGFTDIAKSIRLRRVFGAPPETPENVMKVLVDTFNKAQNDPDFINDMEEAGYSVIPASPDDIDSAVNDGIKLIKANEDIIRSER